MKAKLVLAVMLMCAGSFAQKPAVSSQQQEQQRRRP